MAKFNAGDPVMRPVDVFAVDSPMRTGIVLERYTASSRIGGYYPELYAVRWDDGREERGFLPHGLFPMDPALRLRPAPLRRPAQ